MFRSENGGLFREPGGIRESLMYVGCGVLSLGVALYARPIKEAAIAFLVTGTFYLFMALAEALPSRHRKVAGGIRVVGLGVMIVLLGYIIHWIWTVP